MERPARFSLSREDGVTVLRIEGEFELADVPAFRRARGRALRWASPIVVDLTDCEFIDSTATGSLINVFHAAAQARLPYGLVSPPSSQVQQVLELVGILGRIHTFASLGEARASVRAAKEMEAIRRD